MRNYIVLVTLLITANISYAQVGIGTSSPAGSSQLDVSSTTKGLLPPRMTTSQRDAISSPATGLQIYNTDNRAIETYTGTSTEWFTLGRGKGGVSSNTALGVKTLFMNTTGQDNTATGYYSLFNNTTGGKNSAFGRSALYNNSIGVQNTAVGYYALYDNTANYNTAVGYLSVENNSSGTHNSAMGIMALRTNTTGSYNTALGGHSLYLNATGSNNTAIGRYALYRNTNNHNTAIGYDALYNNTTGSYNTALGRDADIAYTYLTNATAIGYNAVATADNRVKIGNSAVTHIQGQVAFTSVSDKRVKENVQEAVPGLSFIAELRPVTYTLNTRKQDEITMQAMPDSIKEKHMLSDEDYLESSSIVRTGFIAQEVEAAAKKVGFDFDGVSTPENESDLYGIRYAEFVVPLVKAMQEQQEIIEELQATVRDLLKRIETLE
jgi:hypothetical protein